MDDSLTSSLHHQAIEAALSYNWEQAVKLNKQIIKHSPDDIDCLNRLARAFFELGKYSQAKRIYQQVLKIDVYNQIANKNLKKISLFKKNLPENGLGKLPPGEGLTLSPLFFLEEAGVTKVVSLVKLAEPQKLSHFSPGQLVKLTAKNRFISVTDFKDNYLGVLPDDISHLLLKLTKGGNKYQAIIKSIKPNGLAILIRETFRSRKFKNQPSFVSDNKGATYSSDHISLNQDEVDKITDEVGENEGLPI